MRLILSNTSGVPIYEQIKEQVKSAILSGELQENEQLPSLRELAKELRISVLTTTRAYTELEQEGFVANVHGRGCFVLSKSNELLREQLLREIESNLTAAIQVAKNAGLSHQELTEIFETLLKSDKDENGG